MKGFLKYIGGVILFGLAVSAYMTWWKAGLPERVDRLLEAEEHKAGRFTMTDYAAKLDTGKHSEEFITIDGQRVPCTVNMEGRKGTVVVHLPDGTDRIVFVDAIIEPSKVTYHYHTVLPEKSWDKVVTIDELNKSAQARNK